MVQIARKHTDQFDKIRDNIENSYQAFRGNIDRFNEFKDYTFNSSISADDVSKNQKIKKPIIEFNVLEAFLSRLRGEFATQNPSIDVLPLNPNADPMTIEVLEGHLRYILDEANSVGMSNEIYNDTLGGGFSAFKIWTEYKGDSFEQVIKMGRVYDPTLCGFDPLARLGSKADAQYCYELFPMYEEDFEREYPGININNVKWHSIDTGFKWFYETGERKIVLVAFYYEKQIKKVKKHLLSNGQEMFDDDYQQKVQNWNDIALPPVIKQSRMVNRTNIIRYKICGTGLIDKPEITPYEMMPLIFVDGNSQWLRKNHDQNLSQMTRPYIFHAWGTQKLKNYLGQTFTQEMQNMEQRKWLADERAIPSQYVEAWKNTQIPGTLIHRSIDEDGNEIPTPVPVMRTPIPPEILAGFTACDSTIQSILGAYDASLGINDNQLSGVAIENGAAQSNAAAKPYLTNFMTSLTQAAKFILHIIPKFYVTPRTLPIIDKNGKANFVKVNQQLQMSQMPTPTSGPSTGMQQMNAQQPGIGMQQSPMVGMQPPMGMPSNAPIRMQQPQQMGPQQTSQQSPLSMMYEHNTFDVKVQAGVNSKLEKNRALQLMAQTAQSFPVVGQFLNAVGLPTILKNMDIVDQHELVDQATQWMQQQAQQPPQPNPEMMKLQLQANDQKMEQEKTAHQQGIDVARLHMDNEQIMNDRLKLMMEQKQASTDSDVQMIKAATEREAKKVDLAMKVADMHHTHTRNQLDYINNQLQGDQNNG